MDEIILISHSAWCTYVRPETNGRKQLKTGISLTPSPQILDVLESFHVRKNVRFCVNGNPDNKCTSDFIEVEFSIDVEVWHIDDIVQNVPAEGGVRIEQSLSSYSIGE